MHHSVDSDDLIDSQSQHQSYKSKSSDSGLETASNYRHGLFFGVDSIDQYVNENGSPKSEERFLEPDGPQTRALVRILLAIVLLVFTVALAHVALTSLIQLTQMPLALFGVVIIGQVTPIPVVLVAGYHIDRRVLADLGLGIDRDWWVDPYRRHVCC